MQLGDFFKSAPYACPVNPKVLKFTCVAKAKTLPGGTQNPTGRPMRATVEAAMVFLDGNELADAQIEARRAARERVNKDLPKDAPPEAPSAGDVNTELTYHMLTRFLREWDADGKRVGAPMFATVDLARELVVFSEADRVVGKYNEYVREEHPEDAPPDEKFPVTSK